ncbi:hypothetical protein K9L05_04215 [Candidatus Babeliales bacterium]|nr:hypothetical protein [Candidatus Babeliales bacterium]MCF7899817.1 hypothetical protein [Candidatus Babeliales bacterium]
MKKSIYFLIFLLFFNIFFQKNINSDIYPEIEGAKFSHLKPLKMTIDIKMESLDPNLQSAYFKYTDVSFWNKKDFEKINNNQNLFRAEEILGFFSIFKGLKDYAESFVADFKEADRSFVLSCRIKFFPTEEKLSAFKTRYKYDFSWFLDNLKLDFIKNNFTLKNDKMLYWEGLIDNVPITINIEFDFPIAFNSKQVWNKFE